MKRATFKAELESMTIGHTKMIGWEPVTRWAENSFELETWGVKTATLEDVLESLCRLRGVA